MQQYHNRLPRELPSESRHRNFEDFDAIAARLHIKDMGGCKTTRDVVHTVEDEYRSYTKGNLTELGKNPLQFWDVRLSSSAYHTGQQALTKTCRSIAERFQPCLLSLWTIYRFKRRRSLANGFSPPARKQTP